MYATRHEIAITTDADGNAVAYTPQVNGRILSIHYVKPASGGFADGVDFTITGEATGQSVWAETNVNASATRAPRQLTYTTTGSSIAYAATFGVYDSIVLAQERLKIAIAQGGNGGVGTFHVVVG